MKKLLLILLLLLVFSACSDSKDEKGVVESEVETETESEVEQFENSEQNFGYNIPDNNVFTKLTIDEFYDTIKNEENVYVLFGRNT